MTKGSCFLQVLQEALKIPTMHFNISCLEIIIPLNLSSLDMQQPRKMYEGSGPTKTKERSCSLCKGYEVQS